MVLVSHLVACGCSSWPLKFPEAVRLTVAIPGAESGAFCLVFLVTMSHCTSCVGIIIAGDNMGKGPEAITSQKRTRFYHS